uniref:Reverse transcriptase domain-containing protein n=1 Tax=Cannabis sativa TaxID=3483 RepID=A0A803QG53_CANSA
MLFADDSFLYCKVNREEAQQVLELLNAFERASGQKVNLVFFSSNTDVGTRDSILSTLHMRAADDHSLYLGLPSMVGRNKTVTFGFLKEK